MNTSLIPHQFQFLVDDLCFRVVASDVSTTSFDNYYVVVANDLLNVRNLCDRGTMDAEVSAIGIPSNWFSLSLISQMVQQIDSPEDATLDEQADFLRSHFTTVSKMRSRENLGDTEACLLQFVRQRLEKRFPGCIKEGFNE